MIIKKIKIKNIRSYKNQELIFPEGSVLLSGDIGSGKTSILLGIEFALFGLQPGQRGTALLKNGENSGGVILEFEVDGKSVIVERTLKRTKTVSQDYCSITYDGEKSELSVTQLKDKVLDILGYPREFAKKQNILYKFTVYTPQEEMKQIILEDPETRINTLRNIFGIDKYKRIIENVSILTLKLREEKRAKEGLVETLEQEKLNLFSKEEELESKHYNLISVEKELFVKTEVHKRIKEEMDAILEKREERKKLQQEVEKTKIMVSNKKENLKMNEKISEQLKLQIEEILNKNFKEENILDIEHKIRLLRIEKEVLNEDNLKISSQINSLNLKNKENEAIKEKIKNIELCPTCLQDVGPTYKVNVINRLDSNIVENLNKIKVLTEEKEKLIPKMSSFNEKIQHLENELHEIKLLKSKFQELEEKKKRLSELEKVDDSAKKDIEILDAHIQNLINETFNLTKFENLFQLKQKELEEALKQERIAEIKVAELKKEIEVFSRQIEELKERIKYVEKIKEKLNYLTKIESWLSKNFSPLISLIEKKVMMKLKSEFSKLFEKWFSMLVSDVFEVRLEDDFTPIIEYQDYELDYNYLSGGERTAVALAYRLSLNQVVNSLLSKIKTRDIVILDEPTDGFSEQQLDKMRDVLNQLNVRQLIVVSHEQKIESFMDNVIRFKKEKGISSITSESFIK